MEHAIHIGSTQLRSQIVLDTHDANLMVWRLVVADCGHPDTQIGRGSAQITETRKSPFHAASTRRNLPIRRVCAKRMGRTRLPVFAFISRRNVKEMLRNDLVLTVGGTRGSCAFFLAGHLSMSR
jgi:hypothetical protein